MSEGISQKKKRGAHAVECKKILQCGVWVKKQAFSEQISKDQFKWKKHDCTESGHANTFGQTVAHMGVCSSQESQQSSRKFGNNEPSGTRETSSFDLPDNENLHVVWDGIYSAQNKEENKENMFRKMPESTSEQNIQDQTMIRFESWWRLTHSSLFFLLCRKKVEHNLDLFLDA